jgi:hypothetical protein
MIEAMNETTIKPIGVLDESMARTILDKMSLAGNPRIDASGLTLVLPSGILVLKEYQGNLIEITGLKKPLQDECVRYGLSSSAGTIWLGKTEKKPDGIFCKGCTNTFRVTSVGHYACPHCGIHLYVDSAGRASFYEALRKFF